MDLVCGNCGHTNRNHYMLGDTRCGHVDCGCTKFVDMPMESTPQEPLCNNCRHTRGKHFAVIPFRCGFNNCFCEGFEASMLVGIDPPEEEDGYPYPEYVPKDQKWALFFDGSHQSAMQISDWIYSENGAAAWRRPDENYTSAIYIEQNNYTTDFWLEAGNYVVRDSNGYFSQMNKPSFESKYVPR